MVKPIELKKFIVNHRGQVLFLDDPRLRPHMLMWAGPAY